MGLWNSTLWGNKCDLYTKKNKAKDCAHPLVELSGVDECVQTTLESHIPDLTYDIITNILTRLPAKCIFRLWKAHVLYDLITDPYFLRTLLDRSRDTSTVVVQSVVESDASNIIKFFLTDGETENVKAAACLDLRSCNCEGPIVLCGSYDGFFLFRCVVRPELFCIWNPITKERVIVTNPVILSHVCGFYFHPVNKEYEVICVHMLTTKKIWEFQIVSLRTKHRRSLGSCSYGPITRKPPVIVKGTFYWMVDSFMYLMENGVRPSLPNSILSFNIETEKFSTMEVPPYDKKHREDVFHLFELEGCLSLYDTSKLSAAVIWMLNYDTGRWVKKHSITSPLFHRHSAGFFMYFTEIIEYNKMNGDLIAYTPANLTSPCVYNLRSGIWKPFELKGFQGDNKFAATSHTHSLVSLDAANSVIPVEW